MTPNWNDIDRCPIWKILGVGECDSCGTTEQCWGDEILLPEPSPEAQQHWEDSLRQYINKRGGQPK